MWPFGSVLFLVLVGSPVSGTSGLKTITVKAGENVILPCRDPNINQVSVLEWNRTDLQENEYVFFYRSGEPFLAGQPESFKNRVFLKNNQTKDGDLSVVLKNLKIEDSGTYKSRVLKTGTKISLSQTLPICSIHLVVSPPDPKIISAEPGEDIILPCRDPNINNDPVFKWTRTDLQEDEYVFFYRDEHPFLAAQHESFQNRVFLNNNQMKDGDLSVVLKNVKMEDSGKYKCRVNHENDPSGDHLKLISSIHLLVCSSGNTGGKIWRIVALIAVPGLAVAVAVAVVVVVVVVVRWIRIKKDRPTSRSLFLIRNSDDIQAMIQSIDKKLRLDPDWVVHVFVFHSVPGTVSEIEELIKKSLSVKTKSPKIRIRRLNSESLEDLYLLVNELQQPPEDLLQLSKAGCS